MLLNKFVRADGSVIDASQIVSCKYISEVNSQNNLSVGDTTADTVEVELRASSAPVEDGEELVYYQIEDGTQTRIGVFYAEAPTSVSKSAYRFTAYDASAKLAADFSGWLNENQAQFPMTVRALTEQACNIAGVRLQTESFANETLTVGAFYADGVTCRQIVGWAAQFAGCFVRCSTLGVLEFAWYGQSAVTITAAASGTLQYRQDKLTVSGYQTDTIARVQFKQEANDVGVIYPPDAEGNVFAISQNGLAAQMDAQTLLSVAQSLYLKLKDISYTPLEVSVKRTAAVKAGDILSVTDAGGNTFATYVMQICLDASGTTVRSTGDRNYADKAAVSSEAYKNIPGKVLTLQKDVDGLRIENRDTEGKLASLSLTVDGIQTQVNRNGEAITQIQQDAEQIDIKVQKIIDDGVDKVSTEFGLTIDGSCVDIHRSGEEMHNSLDETGMYVRRGDEIMLQANNKGVIATDVQVRNYLIVGDHARFENYSNGTDSKRTACFWI